MAKVAFIRKIKFLEGRNLDLRNVTTADAEFLFGLRTTPYKGRFLSATSERVEDQVEWLEKYEFSQDQAYCIIMDKTGRSLGCVRIYEPDKSSFSWGSWLLIDGLGPMVALESALLVYACGLDMGFEEARLSVRLQNESVRKFHERIFSAEKIRIRKFDVDYKVNSKCILAALEKYNNLLPDKFSVQYFEG